MGGKAKAPPAPDYASAAKATAAGDLEAAKYATEANRVNQYTPYGSLTYTNDGNNHWTQTTSLTPQLQKALDSQINIQQNQSDLANTLQAQVAQRMSQPLQTPDVATYMSGVPQTKMDFGSFNASGVGGVDQGRYDPSTFASGTQNVSQNLHTNAAPVNQRMMSWARPQDQNFGSDASVARDARAFTSGAGDVDINAPQFSDANAQHGADAAYKASTALLQPQWDQDNKNLDTQLRLQGLTPGTEAYNNAMQNQQRVQAQTLSQLANQAVVTGNNMANQNYASALAGYGAKNNAQNQAYTQGANTFQLNNSAAGQQFGQDLAGFQANNDASNTQFNQDLSRFNANNGAQNQAYTQGANTFQLNNDARTQSLHNALSLYNAQLQGQQAYNQSQGQAYDQALSAYGANQAAIQNQNAAQQQAYAQQMNNYQTAYSQAMQNYLQPLNAMNAVLNGNQVQSPTFSGYAQQGQTSGANMLGAAQMQGQYNSGVYAQQSANRNAVMGTLGQLGGSAMLAMSDKRLKTNIRKIGVTEGGHNWYAWDWKDGSGSSRGVIAQEVAQKVPHAVLHAANDYYMVDYAAIR